MQCPACGQMLVIDDEPDGLEPAEPAETDELEEVRIRRIIRDRRAMVRTRGYQIVVLLACVIGAAQLALRLYASGKNTDRLGYAAAIILLVIIGWNFVGRLRASSDRMKRSALPEPTTPPDFTGLSDGSQHLDNLKNFGRYDKH